MGLRVDELRPGLWRWTTPHPRWQRGAGWPRDVGSVYVEAADAIVLVDPLVPNDAADGRRFWAALDHDRRRLRERRVEVLLTAAWHRRSADEIAARYGGRVWRPGDAAPLPAAVEPEVFEAEDGWREAVFVLADHGALVAGDVLEGDGAGGLRMPPEWWPRDAARTARVRRDLRRRLLRHDVELVLVSHGEPVLEHGRDALERALAD